MGESKKLNHPIENHRTRRLRRRARARPRQRQLIQRLKQAILAGQLPAGGKLPASRVLADELDFGRSPDLYGLFNSAKEARNSLKKIGDAHHLCHVLLGLEKQRPGKPCFGHQMHNCKGACCGKESLSQHGARLMAALAKLKVKEWPYAGPVGLVEKDDFSSTTDLHVVDHWAYLGTAQREEQVWEILQQQGIFGLGELRLGRGRQQRPDGHTGQRGERGQLLHCNLP